METISRRSALTTLGQLSLAPALLSIGSPLLQRESSSGTDSPQEVTAKLLEGATDFLYWHFTPGSDRIFRELAKRDPRKDWPYQIERAKTETMMYHYLGQPDGPLTPKRLWDIADKVGTPLTIFVSQRAADSGLLFPKS